MCQISIFEVVIMVFCFAVSMALLIDSIQIKKVSKNDD